MALQFAALVLTAAPPGLPADGDPSSIKIDGREALLRSVELFLNRDGIPSTIVAFQPAALEEGKRKHGNHFGFTGVRVVGAGPGWAQQIAAALEKVPPEITHVILHDAARPAVPYPDLEAVMAAAEMHEAVALMSRSDAPLLEVDEAGQAVGMREAGAFVRLVTPQVYAVGVLRKAIAGGEMPAVSALHLIEGSVLNQRLSGGAGAGMLKALVGQLPKPKIKASNNPFEEAQW